MIVMLYLELFRVQAGRHFHESHRKMGVGLSQEYLRFTE